VRDQVSPYFENPDAVVVGITLAFGGAVLIAIACRGMLPDRLAGRDLRIPRFRAERAAIAAVCASVILTGHLYWTLANGRYTHWQIVEFEASLALMGFAIHRLDQRDRASTYRLSRVDVEIMLAVLAASLAVGSVDLTHWRFAWIGDEGSFFDAGRKIADGRESWNVFSLSYVYNVHPILDLLGHATGIKLLGPCVPGWR
jgi:hypothetical protein